MAQRAMIRQFGFRDGRIQPTGDYITVSMSGRNRNGLLRDSQQRKVYKAEWHARRLLYGTADCADSPQMTWTELSDLADAEWKAVERHVPMPELRLNRRRSTMSAYWPREHRIDIAPTMQCPLVILHELQHAATALQLVNGEIQAHGPEFVKLLTGAIDRHLPFEVQQAYREGKRLHRVR